MRQNGSLVSSEILVVDDEADIRELMAGVFPMKDMNQGRF